MLLARCDRAAVHRHRVRVVQEPDVGAELFHVGAHRQQHRDGAQPADDAADAERVGDRLAQAELLRHLEVGDRARFVAADLDHVDRVVGAVERGAPVGGRRDLGRRVERVGDPAGDELRRREPFGVDVEQRDLGVGELLVPEDVAEQVAGEDGAPAPMNVILATRAGYRAAAASLLAADAVVQDQEREAEHPERVLGAQLAVLDVDVELLGEAVAPRAPSARAVSGST